LEKLLSFFEVVHSLQELIHFLLNEGRVLIEIIQDFNSCLSFGDSVIFVDELRNFKHFFDIVNNWRDFFSWMFRI
jgi:hypothetical protein